MGSLTYAHISSNLPKQIKDGRISSKLLKPYNIAAAQLVHSISLLVNKQIVKLPIFAVILMVILKNFQIQFQLQHVILGFMACLMGFVLHCFIDLCISYGAFWLDDIWAFSHLKILVLMTFGGMSFPLDVIPQQARTVFNLLPFRFMYAFPIAVFQGRVNPSQFLGQTLQALVWLAMFWALSLIIWKRGIKHYGAYGG